MRALKNFILESRLVGNQTSERVVCVAYPIIFPDVGELKVYSVYVNGQCIGYCQLQHNYDQ